MKGLKILEKGDEPLEGKATGLRRPNTRQKRGIDHIEVNRDIDGAVLELFHHPSQRTLVRGYDRFHLPGQFEFLLCSGSNPNLKESILTQTFDHPPHHRTVGKEFSQIIIP